MQLNDSLPWNPLMILYILVALAALALVLAPMAGPSVRMRLPPLLEAYWPWHTLIALGLATAAFLLLLLQSSLGFGVETAFGAIVQGEMKARNLPNNTPEEQRIVHINEGMLAGRFHVQRTSWWMLTILAHIAAVGGLSLEWLLHHREPLPPPYGEVHW